jgi:hypothetical protein
VLKEKTFSFDKGLLAEILQARDSEGRGKDTASDRGETQRGRGGGGGSRGAPFPSSVRSLCTYPFSLSVLAENL